MRECKIKMTRETQMSTAHTHTHIHAGLLNVKQNVAGLVEACEHGGRKQMATSLGFNQHKQKARAKC